MKVVKCWSMLPEEAVEPPADNQNLTGWGSEPPALTDPASVMGMGPSETLPTFVDALNVWMAGSVASWQVMPWWHVWKQLSDNTESLWQGTTPDAWNVSVYIWASLRSGCHALTDLTSNLKCYLCCLQCVASSPVWRPALYPRPRPELLANQVTEERGLCRAPWCPVTRTDVPILLLPPLEQVC